MRSPIHSLSGMLFLALTLLALTGCALTPKDGPPLIVRKPRLTTLPAAILSIDLKPSTGSLSRGLQWSENSERILSDVTPK